MQILRAMLEDPTPARTDIWTHGHHSCVTTAARRPTTLVSVASLCSHLVPRVNDRREQQVAVANECCHPLLELGGGRAVLVDASKINP
eukprot:2588003-Prymnesium_polylepis.1